VLSRKARFARDFGWPEPLCCSADRFYPAGSDYIAMKFGLRSWIDPGGALDI